ncbi:hypothetical protein CP556_20080 [Natrinema sp. CBA1119]|nr:hypothetical protein CP556_20080 [Natrinema sp. CBA1119]
MDPVLRYGEAHWVCDMHGDFPNAALDTDAANLNPTYCSVESWIEAKIVSLLVLSVRVIDSSETIEE